MPYKNPTEQQKAAYRKYQREWLKKKYRENTEFRERKLAKNVERAAARREKVTAYKLEHGCSECGYKKCARALQFHHANSDKEFNIGESLRLGEKRLWAEIAKCTLLCANCHAEAHDEAS